MRIEYCVSTGNPYGQFVVFAESELERTVLHNFLSAKQEGWQFWLHGSVLNCDLNGITSFNFGWVKPKED